jgi:protein TonB
MSEHQFATDDDLDLSAPPRTRRLVAALVIGLHVIAVLGLIQAFAPGFTAKVTEQVISTFTVTVTTPPPSPKPPPPKAPDKAGAAAPEGKKAVPKAAAAPKPEVLIAQRPAPPVAGKGNANSAGATNSGQGTGAGGQGNGTGSGAGGDGRGGGMAARPSVRSGELNNASDFPAPPGGREARFGKSVTVVFTVTSDGRARDCSVARSSVDAEATALVCPLVIRKIRFNPAKRGDGTSIEARYGYKVDFRAR